MKINTVRNITTVTLTWEEWEKQPFPQVSSLKIDHVTRYVIEGVPLDKAELFNDTGIDICLN